MLSEIFSLVSAWSGDDPLAVTTLPPNSVLIRIRRRLTAFFADRMRSDLDRAFTSAGAGALALRIGGTGALLLLNIALARVLGSEGFGEYVYVLSWLSILTIFATLGLDTASLRFVSEYASVRRLGRLRGFVYRAHQWVGAGSLGLAILWAVVVFLLRDRMSLSLLTTFGVASLLLPAMALVQLQASIIRGLQQVLWAIAPQSVLRPILLGASVAVAYRYLESGLTPAWVMGLDLGVTSILVVGLVAVWNRKRPAEIEAETKVYESAFWIRTSLPLLIITGARVLMNKVDVIMTGVLMGATSAGLFAAAAQLSALINFGLYAVNMIAAPMIAQLYAQDRRDELQRIVRLGARTAFGFALLSGGGLLVLGPWVLRLYGPEFGVSYLPLVILIGSQIVNSLTGSVGFILTMTGQERVAARVTLVVVILNLSLNAVLIPHFGLIGAALATALAGVAWNVTLFVLVRRRLHIQPSIFSGRLR